MKKKLFLWCYPVLFFLMGCSSHQAFRNQYLKAYQSGEIARAEKNLETIVQKKMPELQFTESKEAVWLLLDRATVRFSNGNLDGAISDYQKAIEAIDYYSQESTLDDLSQIAFQDESAPYKGEDYEHILAPIYLSLALLQKDDCNNALALLRFAEELEQAKRNRYLSCNYTKHFQLIENSLGKYLLATLLEKKSDLSNARVLYKQVGELIGYGSVESDLRRIANPFKSSKATVLIVCHNGNVPLKVSTEVPASIASAIALECFLNACKSTPAISTITGIPAPELVQKPDSHPLLTTTILDQTQEPLKTFLNIDQTAYFQLEQNKPIIVAKGLARIALRRGIVAFAQNQNDPLGAFVDIGMLIANSATKADTRSWTTLPCRIDLAKYELEKGCHEVSFKIGHYPIQGPYCLNLKENDLCVINIFNIHPGNFVVQIPKRFFQHGYNHEK